MSSVRACAGASRRTAWGGRAPFRVLCIAGSDSGGGAGIEADVRTVAALGGHPLAAITAVTAQSGRGVRSAAAVPATLVRDQIEAVLQDIGADAVKIGMLAAAPVARAVASALESRASLPVVLDPVLRATSGRSLLDDAGRAVLVERLLPRAALVTPNIPEAEALLGRPVRGGRGVRAAAADLLAMGARAVLVKGGHLRGDAVDLYADGRRSFLLRSARVRTSHTHGSGCVLASAVACFLAQGAALPEAVRLAKRFVTAAIRSSYRLGVGHGPVNPTAAGLRFAVRG